jgi:transposase-like protein
MGKKNNSYTASYKLKVLSFAEQFGNRAAEREFGILESNVRYWRKQKEDQDIHKKKSAYFTHPDFSSAKLGKKVSKLCE